ncbi:MAG: hypothetical protein II992_00665, partial [Lachnospiraceae bacterium]|nr:hypothetical protein [Lachnospiraceae bacterium]
MKHNLTKKALGVVLASTMVTTSFENIPGLKWDITSNVRAAATEALYVDKVDYYNSSYDAENAYEGNDLGCNYSKEKTIFKVWSPEADAMILTLYETGSDEEDGAKKLGEYPMTKGEKGVWEYTYSGDIVNTYYTYKGVFGGESSG